MPINTNQLREYIIKPVLNDLDLYSRSATNLLLGTAAQESKMGTYLHQIGGPALGIYQMEPSTNLDIHGNYLSFNHELDTRVDQLCIPSLDIHQNLIYNLGYATAMARLHYYRITEALPDADDVEGLAYYWKVYYNTNLGKGTINEFIGNYNRYVL